MKQTKRYPYIDLIRCVAMTLVVFVHLGPGLLTGHIVTQSMIASIGRLGVPLFVMMTGYLLLGRSYEGESEDKFLCHNFLRLVVAFEVWNVLWYVLGKITWLLPGGNGLPVSLPQAAKAALFIGDTGTALWYLHMSIALYLGIPIVSWAIKRVSRVYAHVLLGTLVFFATVVPSISAVLGHIGVGISIHSVIGMNVFSATVWGGSVWILYALVGFIIRMGWIDGVRTWVLALVFCASLGTQILIGSRSLSMNLPSCNDYSFISVVVSSVALFLLLRRFGQNGFNKRIDSLFEWMASRSFGVYVVHLWAIGVVYSLLRMLGFRPESISSSSAQVAFIGFFGCLILVIGLSLAIVQLLSCSKLVRRWMLLMK